MIITNFSRHLSKAFINLNIQQNAQKLNLSSSLTSSLFTKNTFSFSTMKNPYRNFVRLFRNSWSE